MISQLEYNSTREKLIIPEYGRNIQKMVEYCCTIANREERNASARAIIATMAQIQGIKPESNIEQQHKLWDHLFIISRFQLDVDAPFEKPENNNTSFHPEKPIYNTAITNNYRSYGHNLKEIIDVTCKIEHAESRKRQAIQLANHIKKCYLQWNRESVTDEIIINQLRILSGGKLDVPENTTLMSTAEIAELYKTDNNMTSKNATKNGDEKNKKSSKRKNKKKK